jgi:hypothetical protein
MTGGAPFAKQDQVAMLRILQKDAEIVAVNLEPAVEVVELAAMWSLEEITTLLNLELPAGIE